MGSNNPQLVVGSVQEFVFKPTGKFQAPFYVHEGPLTALDADDIQTMKVKDLQSHLKERGCPVSGKRLELVDRLKDAVATKNNPVSYIGQPKGMKQILWEHGLWEDNMKAEDMKKVLDSCTDFKD